MLHWRQPPASPGQWLVLVRVRGEDRGHGPRAHRLGWEPLGQVRVNTDIVDCDQMYIWWRGKGKILVAVRVSSPRCASRRTLMRMLCRSQITENRGEIFFVVLDKNYLCSFNTARRLKLLEKKEESCLALASGLWQPETVWNDIACYHPKVTW